MNFQAAAAAVDLVFFSPPDLNQPKLSSSALKARKNIFTKYT
jgi:hypothetical protein